jgi:hypothetical protein
VGKGVSSALKNADATKNRLVSIHDVVLSQSKVLDLAKKCSGPDVEWNVKPMSAATELESVLGYIEKDGLDLLNTLALLKAALLGGQYEAKFENLDNELLGLSVLSDSELEERFVTGFKSMAAAMQEFQGKQEGIQGKA